MPESGRALASSPTLDTPPSSSATAAAPPAPAPAASAPTLPLSATPKRDHRISVTRNIRYSEFLRPWMLAYAEWLVTHPTVPTRTERRVTAARLACVALSDRNIRDLELRRDFLDYLDLLQRGPVEAARAKFMSRLPKYIDAHERALDGAIAAEDWRTVAAIAEPALDRVMPKKDVGQATQVNITLQPRQQAALDDVDVDVEVLEPEVLHGDTD